MPLLLRAQENSSHLIRAKVKQGAFMIGGSVNANFYTVSDELTAPGQKFEGTTINAIIKSKIGYFIWNDFAAGVDWTLTHVSLDVSATEVKEKPYRETMMLAGPFFRYYLDNGIFTELTAQLGLHNFTTGNKYDLIDAGFGVGYSHFINEKFSIEPVLTFRYFKKTENDMSYMTMGPMLGVGIQAYIIRKKAHVIKWAL